MIAVFSPICRQLFSSISQLLFVRLPATFSSIWQPFFPHFLGHFNPCASCICPSFERFFLHLPSGFHLPASRVYNLLLAAFLSFC
jgi:hypothetical protein